MSKNQNASVKEWIQTYIKTFREAASKLSAEERKRISNLEDFSEPCQVHLFRFYVDPDIDYSLLICTRLKNIPDGLVEIIGPMHPSESNITFVDVLKWERWNEEIEDPRFLMNDDRSARRTVANQLAQAKRTLDQHVLRSMYSKNPVPSMIPRKT